MRALSGSIIESFTALGVKILWITPGFILSSAPEHPLWTRLAAGASGPSVKYKHEMYGHSLSYSESIVLFCVHTECRTLLPRPTFFAILCVVQHKKLCIQNINYDGISCWMTCVCGWLCFCWHLLFMLQCLHDNHCYMSPRFWTHIPGCTIIDHSKTERSLFHFFRLCNEFCTLSFLRFFPYWNILIVSGVKSVVCNILIIHFESHSSWIELKVFKWKKTHRGNNYSILKHFKRGIFNLNLFLADWN